MAGIQLRLQKELFAPNDEQLMAMAHCFKSQVSSAASKKKEIFLCVLNEIGHRGGGGAGGGGLNITISEVKADPGPASGGTAAPKRKRSWTLRELTGIDGRSVQSYYSLQFYGLRTAGFIFEHHF